MKRKVSLITIHYVDNHGGVLLAYALQESVNRLGYECSIIDYDPTPIPSKAGFYLRVIGRRILHFPMYLRNFRFYLELMVRNKSAILPPIHTHGSIGMRKEKFDAFRQRHLKLTERHYTSDEALNAAPPPSDAFICGSDQIWNPFICKTAETARNDSAYFLAFAPEEKRISYAPSIAIPSIPEKFREEMREFILRIPHLSTREKQGAQLVKELTGRDAQVVLDPTLLLDAEAWSRIAVDPDIKGPYILCYFLGEGVEYRTFAQQLHQKTGLPLVFITREIQDLTDGVVINGNNAGPAEFLGYIKNASLVCTDSFHGTIFSINFKTPFYVFERPGSSSAASMASRIYSILDLLGLISRLVRSGMPFPEAPLQLDFSDAEARLAGERTRSWNYLRQALSEVTGRDAK